MVTFGLGSPTLGGVDPPLESEVERLARRIAELARPPRRMGLGASGWNERLMQWAMKDPSFKTQLFRLVDVFPTTTDEDDVLDHIEQYLGTGSAPRVVDRGLGVARHAPFGPAVAAAVARHSIAGLAGQFIVGATATKATDGLHRLWERGYAFTADLLGEHVVTPGEADRYAARVAELLTLLITRTPGWSPDDRLDRDDFGALPRVNLSIKPTALATHYAPLTRAEGLAEAQSRLRPILLKARDAGAHVHLDMEHHDVKDLTLELLQRLVADPDLVGLQLGVVVQAYLRDSYADLANVIELSRHRSPPLTVRLVKGSYWDAESIGSRAAGWTVPVFTEKAETDANYERCAALLHDNHGAVRAAFGSHSVRSLAFAIAYARSLGIPDNGYEVQMLFGMAEPLHAAVVELGLRLRVYTPVGELLPGMAYLVRRLLENTSNESFVRHRRLDRKAVVVLARAPAVKELPGPPPEAVRKETKPERPGDYQPERPAEWRRSTVREQSAASVSTARGLEVDVPALIGGERVRTAEAIDSVDPAEPGRVVARSSSCGPAEVERAVECAGRAVVAWSRTPAVDRAAVLFRAAQHLRSRRFELAALEVFEAGKPWAEADADVCEAIDFCEYYGRRMLLLDAGAQVQSPPGESNAMRYEALGIGAVIAPWNFPLAIPTGMVTAALVAGNAVLFKPAEQTPAIAWRLVEALQAGGLPDGVLAFLPGLGETVGAELVRRPEVAFVNFTGSKAVGLDIVEQAAIHRPGQRQVKRVVAEMGGKNAIVVDTDADLDQAVPIIVSSAFGFSGQKCSACSRVVVVGKVHDELVTRLVGAAGELRLGHPADMGVQMGPLIDAEAQARVRRYAEKAAEEGEVVLAEGNVPEEGFFAGPTIVTGVQPGARIATDEIFGPVLAVLRAGTFDEAIALANETDYALTGGIVSRSPTHISRACQELRAGNIYVNRSITGAVVGRHPFGGNGMSGVGSKAGGPDYLLQFTQPRSVSENTMRQGIAPE
jgi:RHH-type transcriptional regulator, proline utilization regulon repressor / proline dehydrogenase / delta 1-pyrroline-5-carboxylate dehydrogenase